MLATVDTSGGGAYLVTGNNQLYTFNAFRAIRAIATAASGSVPVANVVMQANLQANGLIQAQANALLTPYTTTSGTYTNNSVIYGLTTNTTILAPYNAISLTATATSTTMTVTANAALVTTTATAASGTNSIVVASSNGVIAQATTTATQASVGSNNVVVAAATNIVVGQYIIAAGIPAGTYVAQNYVAGSTTVPLASITGVPVGTTAALSTTAINFYNPGIQAGQNIVAAGIPAGTVVGNSYVPGSTTVPLTNIFGQSVNTTSSLSATAINFYGQITPSMLLSGTSVVPATLYIVNQATSTTTAVASPTGSGTGASSSITVSSATGILPGLLITGTGIANGTYVANTYTSGTTIPLSTYGGGTATTSGAVSGTVNFYSPGSLGTYNLSAAYTSGTITTGTTYVLAANQAATAATGAAITGTWFGSNNMVTTIANTDGGGWSLDVNNTVGDNFSMSNTVVTTATATGLVLDLYNTTSITKSLYNYHKISMVHTPGLAASAIAPTNNSILVYHGGANGQGFTNSTSAFNGGSAATIGTTAPQGPASMVNQRSTYNGASQSSFNWLANDFFFTVACNNAYMHVVSNNFVVSMGLRDTQAWEDNYGDNPPVYNFSVDSRTAGTSVFYPASAFMYARSISNTGTFNPPSVYRNALTTIVASAVVNPVTGQAASTASAAPQTFDLNYAKTRTPSATLFQLSQHYLSTSYVLSYPPTYDTTTGSFVPPAFPVIMQLSSGNYNYGGKVKGLYKSLSSGFNSSTGMTLTQYYTPGASYTVDGEDYYPVTTGANAAATSVGTDLFLLRRF